MPDIVDALGGADAIRHHCDPANYLGLAPQMVDHMLSQLGGKPSVAKPSVGEPGAR
jgi:hypothetical protein